MRSQCDLPEPPDAPSVQVAWLQGTLCAQAAFAEPDDIVLRDLAAARQRRAS